MSAPGSILGAPRLFDHVLQALERLGTNDGPGASTGAGFDAAGLRSLRRDPNDRVLGGVAAGIAHHFGIDPVLVRLGFVVTTFLGGIGAIAYFVAWVVLPSAPAAPEATRRRTDRRQLLGYALVALGLAVVPGRFGVSFHGGGVLWPLALIGLGVAVLWLRTRDLEPPGARSTDDPPTGPSAGPPAGPPGGTSLHGMPASAGSVPVALAPIPLPAPPAAPGAAPPPGPGDAPPPTPDRAPDVKQLRERSPLGAMTVSALLVLAGTVWLLDVTGTVHVDLGVAIACALALVGLSLLISAWYGRARALIALGILLLPIVLALGLVDVPLRGGVGDPHYVPRTLAGVHANYELAVGDLTLDLSHVDFTHTDRTVRAQLGIGRLNVVVPQDTRVVVNAHSGVGDVVVFGHRTRDCCPTDVRRVQAGVAGGGTLRLAARVGAGHVEVTTEEAVRASS